MKKILLFTPLLVLSSALPAQFYIAPTFSYSVPVMKQVISQDIIAGQNAVYVFNGMYGSFGGGTAFGGTFGYKKEPQGWVYEISCESFKSNTIATEYNDSTPAPDQMEYRREMQLKGLSIVPKFGYSITRGNFSFGLINGVVIGTNLKMHALYSEKGYNWNRETEEEQFGNISLGFRSALSFRYQFYKGLYAGVDLTGNFQSWRPEKGEVVKSETNGTDDLASASYAYSHFVFAESFTQSVSSYSPDEPAQRFAKVYSLSNVGARFSIGIQFHYATKSGKVL